MREGMRMTEANQVSSLLDLIGHTGDCEKACNAIAELEKYKQSLINDDKYEFLQDLKLLEEIHGVLINYKDHKGIKCIITPVRIYSCCGRRV